MNRSTLLILATVALALMLAACTGAAAAPSVASLDDPAASGTPAPSASPMTPQDAALAYAGCMRENGIDMPDPVVTDDGEGRVSISQGASDRNGSKEEFLEAEEECRHFMEAAMPTEDLEPLSAEDMDKMLAFAQCMREHGIPMDDPSADGGIRIGIDDSGTGGKPPINEDELGAAHEACGDLLPGKMGTKPGLNSEGGEPAGGSKVVPDPAESN